MENLIWFVIGVMFGVGFMFFAFLPLSIAGFFSEYADNKPVVIKSGEDFYKVTVESVDVRKDNS